MAFYFLPLGSRGATYAPITNGRLNRKVFKTDVFVNKAGKPVSAHYRARTDNPSRVAMIIETVSSAHSIAGRRRHSRQSVVVTHPPGGVSPSHRHAQSAFIYPFVLSGAIRSRVNTDPARVYQVGESFFEEPGARHIVSENASEPEPASLLAVFVVDTGDMKLMTPDK
jgi:quercetin dioxygenase-like cupin family protein